MPKDVKSTFSQSHFPSVPVALAVEYKDPAMHQSRCLPDKIIQDFGYLGLSKPSLANIHDSIGDWVEVQLLCIPFELKRLKFFELSKDRAIIDLKDRCGIKRIWRLTRSPYKPTVGPGMKRPFVNSDTDIDVMQKRKKTEPGPPFNITSPSESDSTQSSSVTSSQDMPLSLTKLLRERLSATDSPVHAGPLERPQSHVQETFISREKDTIDDIVLLRMLPLDQSELPQRVDVGDDPIEEPSSQTRDPRRSGFNCYASPGESTGSQEQNGYPAGTQLLLVNTDEKRPCGWETKLRRLFQSEQRRQTELRVPFELEREEATRRIESLEKELQESRQLVREMRTELEMHKVRNMHLEVKMEDIRRECEHPFVVPSLIDAFLKMGDLSDAVMQD